MLCFKVKEKKWKKKQSLTITKMNYTKSTFQEICLFLSCFVSLCSTLVQDAGRTLKLFFNISALIKNYSTSAHYSLLGILVFTTYPFLILILHPLVFSSRNLKFVKSSNWLNIVLKV